MKRIIITTFALGLLASTALAQTTYDSKTLVDTNNNSTSTSTVNTNNTSTSTSTATSTSTVNTNSTNTNNNVMSGSVTYNNNNVNSGTMTYNNNNSSTSTSVNTNNNVNTGDMTNRNINTSTSTSTNTNTNNNVNTGDMTNRNINTSTSANNNVNQNINSGDMTNRNINDTTMRVVQPPPTAIAPAMMSGGNNDLCTTGTSGSVQTQIFGVSSGGTVRDMNCERLKLSKTLYDMGMKVAAVATMCQDRRVFDAMLAAGTPCPVEGKIGEQARAYWDSNPEKLPKLEEPKDDDTYKKVGIGSILGIAVYKLFGL